MTRRPALALLSLALAIAPAAETAAQQRAPSARQGARPPDSKPSDKEPAAPAEPPPPPYDRELLRLSEIIGALAFLRELCAAPDASEWPARMKALVEAEGVTQNRRDRLAGAYNRGYRGYAVTYRTCTPSANEATGRFLAEGERLSQTISGRFGG